MSKSTLHFHEFGSITPEHPEWCNHSESCQEFSLWSHAVHRGPVETFFTVNMTGDWESNAAIVQAMIQTIELRDGTLASTVDFSIHSETGGLQLDPQNMRAFAAWLNATADNFEGVVS